MPLQPWLCRAPTRGGAAIPWPARGPSAWRGAHGGQATCRAISKLSQEIWGWPWGRAGMAEQKSLGTGTPRHLPRVFRPVTQHQGGCGGHGVLRPLWIAGTPPGFKGQPKSPFPCPGVLLVLPRPSISSAPQKLQGKLGSPQASPSRPLGWLRAAPSPQIPPAPLPRSRIPRASPGGVPWAGLKAAPGDGAGSWGRFFPFCWLRRREMLLLLQIETPKQDLSPGTPPVPEGLGNSEGSEADPGSRWPLFTPPLLGWRRGAGV